MLRILSAFQLFCWLVVSLLLFYFHSQTVKLRELSSRQGLIIEEYRTRQLSAEALDRKYQKDLTDAQSEIDSLRDAVSAGTKRVRVRAACQPETARAARVDDAASAGLTKDAEQHYLRLRREIVTVTSQVKGLQDYIREQCQR